jgi:uncharacterized lipoprotein YajG
MKRVVAALSLLVFAGCTQSNTNLINERVKFSEIMEVNAQGWTSKSASVSLGGADSTVLLWEDEQMTPSSARSSAKVIIAEQPVIMSKLKDLGFTTVVFSNSKKSWEMSVAKGDYWNVGN